MNPGGVSRATARARETRRRLGWPASQSKLAHHIRRIGVERGDVLIVHTSFRRIGKLRGGPETLISALEKVIGPDGTLCMPSHSYSHEDPELFLDPPPNADLAEAMRAAITPFDPRSTPTTAMGVTAEMFWRLPGVYRSPAANAIAARGPAAQYITSTQSFEDPQGLNSPIGRIYELGGRALLIGCKLDRNTTMHVAEAIAATPWRRRGRQRFADGWYGYDTRLNCGNSFWRIEPLLQEMGLVRYDKIGRARSMLVPVRESVDLAAEILRGEPSYFLCAIGTCLACDRARGYAGVGY